MKLLHPTFLMIALSLTACGKRSSDEQAPNPGPNADGAPQVDMNLVKGLWREVEVKDIDSKVIPEFKDAKKVNYTYNGATKTYVSGTFVKFSDTEFAYLFVNISSQGAVTVSWSNNRKVKYEGNVITVSEKDFEQNNVEYNVLAVDSKQLTTKVRKDSRWLKAGTTFRYERLTEEEANAVGKGPAPLPQPGNQPNPAVEPKTQGKAPEVKITETLGISSRLTTFPSIKETSEERLSKVWTRRELDFYSESERMALKLP